ncbi:MAG: hypothetical protein QOE43_2534 [Gaiellaceae bacterium]|nr:hypothetical protein [Gaiellaceae bacterium]
MAGGVHGGFVGAVADRAAAINDRGYMAVSKSADLTTDHGARVLHARPAEGDQTVIRRHIWADAIPSASLGSQAACTPT